MIKEFQREHRFLSNFWPAEVYLDGIKYPTVEHAYQASKTLDDEERKIVRMAGRPGLAKREGKRVTLRPDWSDEMKLVIMEDLVRQKFQHKELKALLLATGDEELVEGNSWWDTYWGVCKGKGSNHLGKILMKVRQELDK